MTTASEAKTTIAPSVSDSDVLALLQSKGAASQVRAPQLWMDYLNRIAPLLALSPTGEEILQGFVNIDMTAEKLAAILKGNPYYEGQFGRLIDGMAKREVTPSLEASVVLIGMANMRNTALTLLLQRSIKRVHPEWTPEGKLKVQPSEILKVSLKVEEILGEKRDPYSDLGFSAGLVWDVLAYISQGFSPDQRKKSQAWVDSQVDASIQYALLVQDLMRGAGECSLSKYAFVTALLLPVGRVAAGYLDPQFLSLQDLLTKKNIPSALREQIESRVFAMDLNALSAAVCENYPWLRAIASTLALYSSPGLAQKMDPKGAWPLIATLKLAQSILADPGCVEKNDDPRITVWKTNCGLKDYPFDPATFVKATQRFKQTRG